MNDMMMMKNDNRLRLVVLSAMARAYFYCLFLDWIVGKRADLCNLYRLTRNLFALLFDSASCATKKLII